MSQPYLCPCRCHGQSAMDRMCDIEGGCGHLHRAPAVRSVGGSPLCLAPQCDRPTSAGFLCGDCVRFLWKDLEAVAGLWDELELSRTRQVKLGRDSVGARSTSAPLPWNEHTAQVANDLNETMDNWAHHVAKRHGYVMRTYGAPVSAWFLCEHRDSLHVDQEAGALVEEVGYAVKRAIRCVDLPPDEVFAGLCGVRIDDETTCREGLYGRSGRPEIVCVACGAEHDLSQRREWMLGAVEDEVAHSGLLSGLVTSLGVPIASSTIRHYASKGRIKVISKDAQRRPLYRIGDVLDVFLRRAG